MIKILFYLLILFGVPILIFAVIYALIFAFFGLFSNTRNMPKHNSNHPGITDFTMYGQRDIICPKCNSPYCQFYYDIATSKPKYKTKTKIHPLNPFKPFIEEKTTVEKAPDIPIKQYRCNKCGYIFM